MKDKIEQMSNEIWHLKPKTKIDFNKYFEKYEVLEQDKLVCYNAVMKNLEGWVSVVKKHRKTTPELLFNVPHIKNKTYIITPNPINREGIENIINILQTEKTYEEIFPKTENGIMVMGCINYDDRIMKLFRYMPFYKKDYHKNIEKIWKKDISKLNIKETTQYITYIFRKERFCEGIIKHHIDNGILLCLLKHFLEIC